MNMHIHPEQIKNAIHMAELWESRAKAFFDYNNGIDNESYLTLDFCKTYEDGKVAELLADRICVAAKRILGDRANLGDVLIVQAAAASSDNISDYFLMSFT